MTADPSIPSGLAVASARLPAMYENAKSALAECHRIDECRDWADKAEAIASYARQSQDDTLLNTAMRIKGRAVQRCGELLKAIEKANTFRERGDDGRITRGAAADPSGETRATAAKNAGLSTRQQKQAIRVASVPAPVFEAMVERPKPATVTELAEAGKKPSTAHLHGRDPKDYAVSTRGQGLVKSFARETPRLDIATVVRGAVPREITPLREDVKRSMAWLLKLQKALKGKR